MEAKLIKCSLSNKRLTKKLLDNDPKEYYTGKAIFWVSVFNDGYRPITWNKPTTQGTKCTCVPWYTEVEQSIAKEELHCFVNQINDEYQLGLKIRF